MELRTAFGATLRELRVQRGLTQEDFTSVSSRTNVSLLEREKTVPTLEKLAQLCSVLDIHPVTMMALCYSKMENLDSAKLLERVGNELDSIQDIPCSAEVTV